MPLTNAIHESLPYIDTEPTPSERAAAQALVAQDLDTQDTTTSHPSLPALADSNFSPLILSEFERISAQQPLSGIDLTRYEAAEPPASSSDADSEATTTTKNAETLQRWREALRSAYISQSYLQGRQVNLALLERYGKNGWLIGNSQLEDVLRDLERELAERKTDIDGVVIERKNAQEAVGGEIMSLEEGWKRGIGKVLETEVAAEDLRRKILERRRQSAR